MLAWEQGDWEHYLLNGIHFFSDTSRELDNNDADLDRDFFQDIKDIKVLLDKEILEEHKQWVGYYVNVYAYCIDPSKWGIVGWC